MIYTHTPVSKDTARILVQLVPKHDCSNNADADREEIWNDDIDSLGYPECTRCFLLSYLQDTVYWKDINLSFDFEVRVGKLVKETKIVDTWVIE